MNSELIEQGTRLILEGLGVDLANHNFTDTPRRVAKVYAELFGAHPTGYPIFDEDYTDMVVMRGHTFFTMCPHHLLPVKIKASVAYIPGGKVVGASKLMRIIHDINNMPRTQEDLTNQTLLNLNRFTKHTSRGEAVLMRGEHGCFQIRGVRDNASMVTFKFSGEFAEKPELQTRFFQLVNGD